MKLARLPHNPSALLEFFQEGLEALGAVCERSWHDRLQVVAEGPSARLWNPEGALLDTELHFLPPEDPSPRMAEKEVFPGCPLTFRLAGELRANPLPLERGVLQPFGTPKPPTLEVAEKLWTAQMPGSSRLKIEGQLLPGWHFSLIAMARCEIQAIDQHWTLHRVAISLPDGEREEALASSLDFSQLAMAAPSQIDWPQPNLSRYSAFLKAAFAQELELDLVHIRQRQQKYLQRELERIDAYFSGYERELTQRQKRSHSESTRLKTTERLAAAKVEHERRRQDQVRRHEIRIIPHLDALLLLAEPGWKGDVSFQHKGEQHQASALYVPRSRRWLVRTDRP
jgi:hypothetical protein